MTRNFYYALLFTTLAFFTSTAPASAQMPGGGSRSCQEDSRISVAFSGITEITTCTDDGVNDRIRFQVVDFRQAFAYVVVDANDIILSIGFDNFINFDMLPPGTLRVYAFSTYGRITAAAGDVFSTATLSTPCFGLTENFVTVFNGQSGGTTAGISTPSGETEFTICPGDGIDDVVTVIGESDVDEVTFVITDDAGTVLDITTDTDLNFDDVAVGICRIYAFGGQPPFAVGSNVNDFVPTDCGGTLSTEFITVNRELLEGGTVTTTDGETELSVCPQDGNADEFVFTTAGNTGSNTRYLVTDEDNVVIFVPSGNTVNFDNAAPGICRVWSVSYEGSLIVAVGMDVDDTEVATGCFSISDNFVEVVRRIPEAGTIATTDGETEVLTCPGDGNDDLITVTISGSSDGQLAYVITDGDGNILAVQESPTFNVEGAGTGACRIYGIAYSGTLNTAVTGPVAEAAFSDDCSDLTDDFVLVIREVPTGGTVTTADGETEITRCPGDGAPDLVTFVVSGNEGEQFTYLVTDENNVILAVPPGSEVDFEGAGLGVCRLWGLSYQGTLLAAAGQDAATAALASGCFGLSDNFVTVNRQQPAAGTIALANGETEATLCPGDGIADIVTFVSTGAEADNVAFVVTDADGTILSLPPGASVNFETVDPGTCFVYTVAYTGTLTAQPGDPIDGTDLSDGCFSRSDNRVTILRLEATTGEISLRGGGTEITVCPGDFVPDAVNFDSTGTSLENFNYLVTDTNNVVIRVAFTDVINFETFPLGVCRVWGLGYNGIIMTGPGEIAGEDQLASECSALSPNFVTVTKERPDGGVVTLADGTTSTTVCPGDGEADLVTVVSTGAEGSNFTFLLTTEDNTVLGVREDGEFNFDDAPLGVCRVWGFSYQGELALEIGDSADTTQLATGCFDLSDDFVTIVREEVTGGTIQFVGGGEEATTCPGDGETDLVSFMSTGATANNFAYILTDADNVILSVAIGNEMDFEDAPIGLCRIWGLAYFGTLTAVAGDRIEDADLASGCFALATNFLTVNRLLPIAGTLTFAEDPAADTLAICSNEELLVDRSDDAVGTLDVAVTDTDGNLAGFLHRDGLIIGRLPSGTYTLTGFSVVGQLNAPIGEPFDPEGATTGCIEVTNDLTIELDAVDAGTVTGNGDTIVYLCPENPNDGLVQLATTSEQADANYLYAVTINGVILDTTSAGSYDFTGNPLVELAIYGISYSGELEQPFIGRSVLASELSSRCFDVSAPLSVLNFSPEAGTVSVDGLGSAGVACTVNGEGNLSVSVMGASPAGYAVVVTDTDSIVQLVSLNPDSIPFGELPTGDYLVFGLSYTGNVTAAIGDDLRTAVLADNCFERTEVGVAVRQGGTIDAGIIMNVNGPTDTITFCGPDDPSQLAIVSSTVSGINYRYLITDAEGDIVVPNVQSTIIPFSALADGTYRIYGFNFSGLNQAFFGRNVETDILASECYALTTNFLTVIKTDPDGGTITDADGNTEVAVEIPANGGAAEVAFVNTSDSLYAYRHVITDDQDRIVGVVATPTIDFGPAMPGTYRVYGFAFTGDFVGASGDTIGTNALATGCSDLSDNFVTVTVTEEARIQDVGTDVGIDQHAERSVTLTASPNPASGGELTLRISTSLGALANGSLSIRDINGQVRQTRPLTAAGRRAELRFDVSALSPGIYFLNYLTDTGSHTIRFVKQ